MKKIYFIAAVYNLFYVGTYLEIHFIKIGVCNFKLYIQNNIIRLLSLKYHVKVVYTVSGRSDLK